MFTFSRGQIMRIVVGTLIGIAVCYGITSYGMAYDVQHIPPPILYQFNYYYYLQRIVWILLTGAALGCIATFATIHIDPFENNTKVVASVALLSTLVNEGVVAYQQFVFSTSPNFVPDYFIHLILNIFFFVILAAIPFAVASFVTQLLILPFARSRPSQDFMPPELLHQIEKHNSPGERG